LLVTHNASKFSHASGTCSRAYFCNMLEPNAYMMYV